MSAEFHISSLLVHVRPDFAGAASASIAGLPGAEVHLADDRGRIIVTLESPSEADVLSALDAIQKLPGVLSAGI